MYKNKIKELTVNEIKHLKDGSEVYIVFLNKEEFNLEYCNAHPLHIYEDGIFLDDKGFEYYFENALGDLEYKDIKIYPTPKTKFTKHKINY